MKTGVFDIIFKEKFTCNYTVAVPVNLAPE